MELIFSREDSNRQTDFGWYRKYSVFLTRMHMVSTRLRPEGDVRLALVCQAMSGPG